MGDVLDLRAYLSLAPRPFRGNMLAYNDHARDMRACHALAPSLFHVTWGHVLALKQGFWEVMCVTLKACLSLALEPF